MQVIEELQGQHEMALEKISQLESIITQQSVDMVSVEFEIKLIYTYINMSKVIIYLIIYIE